MYVRFVFLSLSSNCSNIFHASSNSCLLSNSLNESSLKGCSLGPDIVSLAIGWGPGWGEENALLTEGYKKAARITSMRTVAAATILGMCCLITSILFLREVFSPPLLCFPLFGSSPFSFPISSPLIGWDLLISRIS